MTLLGSSTGATIAWIHFLAFDLLVGRWIYLDAEERQISTWLMLPALFLTLMLGPTGFLLYLAVRSFTNFFARQEMARRALTEAAQNREESFLGIAELSQRAASTARGFLRGALDTSWPLTFLGFAMVLTLLATIVGVFVDHRAITGAPVWLKPAKFAISVSIYCFTFVWLLSLTENRPRLVRLAANVTVVSFIVEMVVIITQAARGTTSHFNVTTPLNSFLWLTMGTFIAFVWGMNLLVTVLLVRQRIPDRAFAWSIRLGLFISLVGMAAAGLMVRATPTQMAAISAGQRPHIIGAHSVGVADGGPGLPIVGWSTVGGDLRVAHFVGLHGLQLLTLFGWLLGRRTSATRLKEKRRLSLVWTIGVAYLGIVLLLVWQALRGQSVIHPDNQTISVAATMLILTAISIVSTLASAWRADRRAQGFDSRPGHAAKQHMQAEG